jgi:hypothetical protein
MRADTHAIGHRCAYRCGNTPRVSGVPAAGNIAARDDLQQLRVVCVAFTKIGVQIDRCHFLLPALRPGLFNSYVG